MHCSILCQVQPANLRKGAGLSNQYAGEHHTTESCTCSNRTRFPIGPELPAIPVHLGRLPERMWHGDEVIKRSCRPQTLPCACFSELGREEQPDRMVGLCSVTRSVPTALVEMVAAQHSPPSGLERQLKHNHIRRAASQHRLFYANDGNT